MPLSSRTPSLRVESGDATVKAATFSGALLLAAATDPFDLIRNAVAEAAQLSGGARARWDKDLPDFIDSFGWCTWDAFYSSVSAPGVIQGLETLQESGRRGSGAVPLPFQQSAWTRRAESPVTSSALNVVSSPTGVHPKFLVIDDGWQQVAPDPQFRTEFPQPTVGQSLHPLPSPAITTAR